MKENTFTVLYCKNPLITGPAHFKPCLIQRYAQIYWIYIAESSWVCSSECSTNGVLGYWAWWLSGLGPPVWLYLPPPPLDLWWSLPSTSLPPSRLRVIPGGLTGFSTVCLLRATRLGCSSMGWMEGGTQASFLTLLPISPHMWSHRRSVACWFCLQQASWLHALVAAFPVPAAFPFPLSPLPTTGSYPPPCFRVCPPTASSLSIQADFSKTWKMWYRHSSFCCTSLYCALQILCF